MCISNSGSEDESEDWLSRAAAALGGLSLLSCSSWVACPIIHSTLTGEIQLPFDLN